VHESAAPATHANHEAPAEASPRGGPVGELQIPAVRAGPAVFGERLLEVALPLFQLAGVVEDLDPLAAVGVDEPKLEGAGLELTRFVADVLVAALEPPEHVELIGRSRARLQPVAITRGKRRPHPGALPGRRRALPVRLAALPQLPLFAPDDQIGVLGHARGVARRSSANEEVVVARAHRLPAELLRPP